MEVADQSSTFRRIDLEKQTDAFIRYQPRTVTAARRVL
jgi:hypothetical protein